MKKRLVESFLPNKESIKEIKKETIKESKNSKILYEGTEYECVAAYTFPFSRPGKENLNGRIYTHKLWENVFKKQFSKNESTFGLMNHPEDDGSIKDIFCVWRNPRFSEEKDLCLADCYLFGDNGRLIHEAIKAGGPIGFSTSGLGEIREDDNKTVDEDSFEIERLADAVLNPSYSVFTTDESSKKIEKVEETINKQIKETLTIDNKETLMSDKLKESIEKATRLNLEQILKEADKKETIALRISSLEEALTYTSDDFLSDMKKNIEEKIATLKLESLDLAEKAKTIPVLEENAKVFESEKATLTEKVTSLEKELSDIKEKLETATKVIDEKSNVAKETEHLVEMLNAEKGSRFTSQEYYELAKVNESLDKSIDGLKNENRTLELKATSLEEMNINLKEEIDSLKEELSKKSEALADLEKDIEDGLINEEEAEIDYSAEGPFDYSNFGPGETNDELELEVQQTGEIVDYYESLLSENPNYKKIKEDILKCKTLLEAQTTVLRLSSLVEKAIDRPSFLGDSSRKLTETQSKKAIEDIDVGKFLKNKTGWI